MTAYYNEIDPFAAAWLRELIKAGHIAPGDVDERSIVDVRPDDLRGYNQCHFFAGIGVWSYALRRAGWSDDRPIWTGSCPCQPFSAAGKGGGFDDERHLWPAFYHLIGECGPSVVAGEQVASKDADPWIDLVQTDLEALGYAFGAVPFPSASVGAPHIRDRTYWLADTNGSVGGEGCADIRRRPDRSDAGARTGLSSSSMFVGVDDDDDARLKGHARNGGGAGRQAPSGSVASSGLFGGLADDDDDRRETRFGVRPLRTQHDTEHGISAGRLANPDGGNAGTERQQRCGEQRQQQEDGGSGRLADAVSGQLSQEGRGPLGRIGQSGVGEELGPASPTNGLWRDADWLFCRDGKWRPVEPGTFPLVDGAPARVGRLRGYGNAINAEAATTFIQAYLERDLVVIDAECLRLTGAFS